MTGSPLSGGGVQVTVAARLPATAEAGLGGPGVPTLIAAVVAEGPTPTAFIAATRNV